MTGRLVAVNVGRCRTVPYAAAGLTVSAIDKRPVDGPVRVGRLGCVGDEQADRASHGGPAQAVYAYGREDAAYWERELGRELPCGAFGENLSVTGLDVTGAEIGERWRIGSVVLQATSPRVPCRTFAGFWDVPDLVKRFTAYGETGTYFSVVTAGELCAGDDVAVLSRPGHGVTIRDFFRGWMGDRAQLARVAAVPDLHELDRAAVDARLAAAR